MAEKASALLTRGRLVRSGERGRWASWRASAGRAIKAVVAARGHWLVPLVIGTFLGRATVLGVMKPFGTAYVIALAAFGLRFPALVATIGAMAGAVTSPALVDGLEPWPVLIVVWCVTAGAGRYFRLAPPVIALGALLGAASLRLVAAAFTGDDFVLAAAATGVEMTALVVLSPFVRMWTSRPAELNRGQLASSLIVLGLLVLGTEGVQLYDYSLSELLMRAGLLVAAAAGGLGVGAAAGAAVGMLSVLGTGSLSWTVSLLPPAGLLAGLGAQFGRPGAVVGLFTAHLLLSPYAADGRQIASALAHTLLAAVVVAFVPKGRFGELSALVPGTSEARRARKERRRAAETAARRQMHNVAAVLEEVGRSLARSRQAGASLTEGNFDRFVVDVSERVCAGCSHHDYCWDSHVYGTYRDLLGTAAAVSASGTVRPVDLPDGLRQRCIKPEHLTSGINRLLTSLRPRLQAAASESHRSEGGAQGYSGAPVDVGAQSQRGAGVGDMDPYGAASRQFASIAGIIGAVAYQLEQPHGQPHRIGHHGAKDGSGMNADIPRDAAPDMSPGIYSGTSSGVLPGTSGRRPRYRLMVDTAQAVSEGAVVSGDCFRRVDLPDGRVALIVSDGMGSGERAAMESEAAVTMLERFLLEGFDVHFSAQIINSVLLLRTPDETFATLDVCVFDLSDGTVQLLKTGAAPTYIRRERNNHVDTVFADSLPVGILQAVDVTTVEFRLGVGDLVVMVTDGVLELGSGAGDKADAVSRALRRLDKPDVHEAVDALFKRAHSVPGQKIVDDVTIVAAQLVVA